MKEFVTTSPQQTKKLAQKLASGFHGGEILCLSGNLGAGKTTFTQGLLEALGAEGPYTSPTFNIIKVYQVTSLKVHQEKSELKIPKKLDTRHSTLDISRVYHIDAYRIKSDDLLDLGFNDFAGKENTVTIIEWPENVQDIIPESATWLNFEWLDENRRKITFEQN